jgi:thiamine-monophosphate kinase
MERDLVRWFCQRLPAHPRMLVGPGDDAAVLRLAEDANLVATTDMLMDVVDFHVGRHEPEKIGRKALAANLSDLAAMAASPLAALVSLALPQKGGETLAHRLYEGMLPLAAEFDCPIAGGDTNSWDGPLVISVTVLGEVPRDRRWRRSGARPGDAILVTGSFGGSILGQQFDFTPRVREALWLAENAEIHGAIDVSDGLSLDLSRICEASGCGAAVDPANVPIAPAAEELARQAADGSSPLDHALSDGEDYELILAVPLHAAKKLLADQPLTTPLTMIGSFIKEPGLFGAGEDFKFHALPPRGYEHRLEG